MTTRAPTAPVPVIAPAAEPRYDQQNEDRWRQIVEQALRDLAASVQVTVGGEIDIGGGAGPFPVSPIIGFVHASGSGAAPAYLQLLNPGGSGKNLLIYELSVGFVIHATAATIYGRRTSSPVSLTTPVEGNPIHLDEQDVTSIIGKIYGKDGAGSILTDSGGNFAANGIIEGSTGWKPYPIRTPLAQPILVKPGSAVEFSADSNSASTKIRLYAVWDEIAV